MTVLVCKHNAGFFSCCSVKLNEIISYINANKSIPEHIDCTKLMSLYNPYWLWERPSFDDITSNFFENISNININTTKHYNSLWKISNYSNEHEDIIKKYFTPTGTIINNSNKLIRQNKIFVNNCIGLYVRMTDKQEETNIGKFEDYKNKLNEILKNDPKLKIFVVTDSTDFLNYIKENFDSIFIKELRTTTSHIGIHKFNEVGRFEKSVVENNYNEIINYLFPAFLILSKCKYFVCNSSNCSTWTVIYRKTTKNVYQFLNDKWNTYR
uniref:Uncharacterized protein n=1 Tax=viral metagenome TaxID=1070528 RepID=A0A6C0BV55_9ZZZZ